MRQLLDRAKFDFAQFRIQLLRRHRAVQLAVRFQDADLIHDVQALRQVQCLPRGLLQRLAHRAFVHPLPKRIQQRRNTRSMPDQLFR